MFSLPGANATGIANGAIMPNISSQFHSGLFVSNPSQRFPLPTAGFGDHSAAVLSLNSIIRPSLASPASFRLGVGQDLGQPLFGSGAMEQSRQFPIDDDDGTQDNPEHLPEQVDDDDGGFSAIHDDKNGGARLGGSNGKLSNKICRVCGDRALGYNFNVVSCESCKAFFRRNALKKKEFRCPFNDNCDVTTLSRRFCQKCRLRKCFEVGMKKEWIMNEEQRLQKRKRIEENRQKRRTKTGGGAHHTGVKNSQDHRQLNNATPDGRHSRLDQNDGFANAGFSPGCASPVGICFTNDFSPPSSNSPAGGQPKQQTWIDQSTTLDASAKSESNTSTGSVLSERFTEERPIEPPYPGSDILPTSDDLPDGNWPVKLEHLYQSSCSSLGPVKQSNDGAVDQLNVTDCLSNDAFRYSSILRQPEPSVEAPMITIPKAVLINLINQCHSTRRDSFDYSGKDQLPPIVARAHRLYASDGSSSEEELFKCICHCTCGARTVGSRIGPKLVDRGIGPDGDGDTEQTDVDFRDYSALLSMLSPLDMSPSEAVEPARSPVVGDTNCHGLTALDELKLNELFYANQVIDSPDFSEERPLQSVEAPHDTASSSESSTPSTSSSSAPDVIHMTDVCVRRIIKMCKRLSAFKGLCQDDQIALLKGGCTELMLLRGVMTFIPSQECWRPVGWKNHLLSLDVLKSVKGNVYEKHKRYLHSFRDEWRTSDAIMLCLAAITLFNPQRQNIIHVDAISMERELYVDLLKRYLNLMYGVGTGASEKALEELLQRVEDVERLNDYAAKIFVDVNPRDIEPLLIEIFDLK